MEQFLIPNTTGEIVCNDGARGKKVYCKQLAYDRYCIWEEGNDKMIKCSNVEVHDLGRFVGYFGVDTCMKTDPKVIEMELRGIDWELKHRSS